MTEKRTCNFSSDEIDLLVDIVSEYKHIIECKYTGVVSKKEKKECWANVEIEFNDKNYRNVPRTEQVLKYKWDNMKRDLRRKHVRTKLEMERTGGIYTEIKYSAAEEKVKAIIELSPICDHEEGAADYIEQPNSYFHEELNEHMIVDMKTEPKEDFSTEEMSSCSAGYLELNTPMNSSTQNLELRAQAERFISDNSTDWSSSANRTSFTKRVKSPKQRRNDIKTVSTVATEKMEVPNSQTEMLSRQLQHLEEEHTKRIALMEKESEAKIKFMHKEFQLKIENVALKKRLYEKEIELVQIKIDNERNK